VINRRHFLRAGAASVVALPAAGQAFTRGDTVLGSKLPFYKVVYDNRYPDAVGFSNEVKRLGGVTEAVSGDLSRLWFEDIKPLLDGAPGMVAGLTTELTAMYLTGLSRDENHYTVFHGTHVLQDGTILRHTLKTPDTMLQNISNLSGADNSWGMGLARLMSRFEHSPTARLETTILNERPLPMNEEGTQRMVSWVIAPMYGEGRYT
jgi:hypothetical protein